MNLADFREEATPQDRRTLAGIAVLLVIGLLFGASALAPVKAKVVLVSYQASSGAAIPVVPGAPPGTPGSSTAPGFLSGFFTVQIEKRFKGQRLRFDRVVFFTAEGKQITTMPIATVTRQVRTRVEDSKSNAPELQAPQTVQGTLFLWPLEDATLRFAAFSQQNFGITGDQKLYAVIEGKSGVRKFQIKAPVGTTESAGGF